MYTEDDKDVKVKNKNSNNDYNDFYTAFNNPKEKKDKKETKKAEKIVTKEEEDYSDFYNTDEDVSEPKGKDGVKIVIKIVILILLIVLLAFLILVIVNKRKAEEANEIELNNDSFNLKVGEKEHVTYKIVDNTVTITPTFTSSNPNVVTVDENGEIKAIGGGEATISIHYTVNGKTKTKKCSVKVEGDKKPTTSPTIAPTIPPTIAPTITPTITPTPEIKHDLTLNLKASTTNWTNKDVTITVDAKSDTSVTYLKYAVNCSSNCNYTDVSNNRIVISNNGVTKVTVVAKDQSNLEATKEVTVKIDKVAPSATLSGSNNIVSNSEVNVCVTCSDNISGCKQSKVCKKYTTSKSNQVITVYDNAGNSKSSSSFNVTINTIKPACTLQVSSDGTVSATINETPVYYGFDSSCTGSNELSKKISISASKKGDKVAKSISYYVKNKNGNIGSCYLVVVKECNCTNPNDTSANCPVTCTFRAN